MFEYKPVSKGPKNPDGPFVINYTGFLLSMTAINIILDAIVVCMPLSVIQTLHMSSARKLRCLESFYWACPALLPQRYGSNILES